MNHLTNDGNRNLTSRTDFAGAHTIYYSYDKNDRLTSKWYSGYSAGWTYDAPGNALAITDTYTSLTNTYDDLSRLITATDNAYTPAKVLGYTYYEDGVRASITSTNSALVTYTYDKAKRLDLVTLNGSTEGDYDYNALGQREKLTYGNGAFTAYTYTATTNWLGSVTNKKGTGGATVSSFSYTHDNMGNRKTMTLLNGDVITYTYDAGYQLTSELRTGATPYSIAWAYDGVGNRLSQNKGGAWTYYQFNDANQLISDTINSTTALYSYDSNGNMVSKSTGASLWNWAYDFENRQISYTNSSRVTSYYAYDSAGRRVSKNPAGGVLEQYLYDGANVIADYNYQGTVQTVYITPFLMRLVTLTTGWNRRFY